MENLKKGSMVLSLVSGILEVVVAFVFYWVVYGIIKTNNLNDLSLPMVVLMCGLLGGVLAIVASFFVRSTKIVGAILVIVASLLLIFATIYLIIRSSGSSAIIDSVMIILPFFVVPNALCFAAGVLGLVGGLAKHK
ncbi:MAG: hypothetical protein MJ221_01875 [Bacilli bacterium]|nr:hypothetical protein [Bacilli bacterium]